MNEKHIIELYSIVEKLTGMLKEFTEISNNTFQGQLALIDKLENRITELEEREVGK